MARSQDQYVHIGELGRRLGLILAEQFVLCYECSASLRLLSEEAFDVASTISLHSIEYAYNSGAGWAGVGQCCRLLEPAVIRFAMGAVESYRPSHLISEPNRNIL